MFFQEFIYVIESGEVTYTSQYRIHIENTTIAHHTDIHTFIMFKTTKRQTDQNSKQKIKTHILGVSRHTQCPQDLDDHMVRPKLKDQYTYPESPSIANIPYNDSHRARPRTFQTSTAAYRATGHSLHNHIPHSFPLLSLFR